MSYEARKDRTQRELCPPSLEEQISADNPVRVIDAFVAGLDMEKVGYKRAEPEWTGRPAYDPRDLLKLYLYGYINRVRSSRKLMRECEKNIEVMWLIGSLRPDFRTISDFRKNNRKAVEETFRVFISILREEGLLGEELTVDGTKIRANNSIKRSFTPEVTAKKLAYLEEQIQKLEAYLNDMDSYDQREETLHLDIPKEKMPEKLQELRRRVVKYQGYQQRFAQGEKQILETDPECRTLYSKDGLHPAYNIQTVTDTDSHLITNFKTTVANTDENQLSVMGEVVKKELQRECVHLIAGVLPDCYENTNISVEVQELNCTSCFIRHPDGTVTCPMGREMFKRKDTKYGTVYGSKEACRTCPNRCTESKEGKTVNIGRNSNVVPVVMYGNPKYPVQQLPEDYVISSNNHSLQRKHRAQKRVKLTVKRDKARQQIRKETAEHPFGTIKWYDGAFYFLCRGVEMVTAEMALSNLGYDLRRVIRLTTPKKGDVPGILMLLQQRIKAKMA